MGIKNLMKWIQKNAPDAIKTIKLENLFGRIIAIDASLSIYQFLVSVRHSGQMLADSDGNTTSHLQGVLSRTVRLIESGIRPLYVFDGKPPEMKSGELEKRKERREEAEKELQKAMETGDMEAVDKLSRRTVRLDHEQVMECQNLLNLLGVPFIEAPCEAEAECAALAKAGKCYAVATEDMDTLAFASPILLRHLSYSSGGGDEIIQIDYQTMIQQSGLTHDEFIDFCILCGCDYCETIRGVGPGRAYELIKEYGTIERILDHIDTSKYTIPDDFNFQGARELFKNHPTTVDVDFKWKAPSEAELKSFMVDQKGFSESRIDSVIAKLKKAKSGGRQIRMDSFFSAIPSSSKNNTKIAPKKNEKIPPKRKGK